MAEVKKRKAVYNREADMKYISNLSADEKAEKNRRAAFTRARNFIRDKKYTDEELAELKQLISEREKKLDEN